MGCWQLGKRLVSQVYGIPGSASPTPCCSAQIWASLWYYDAKSSSWGLGRNSTNCRRCNSVQHTFIEHILCLQGRKWKSGLCSQEACCLMGETDLYVTSCKWVLTEVKAKCTEKEKASWRRWHLSLRVHQLATGRSRCVGGRLCRLRHHSKEKGLMAIWGQKYSSLEGGVFLPRVLIMVRSWLPYKGVGNLS